MKTLPFKASVSVNDDDEFHRNIGWELRPCGMLVQKRQPLHHSSSSSSSAMITVKVSYGSYHHDVAVPAQSTFGDLKRALVAETGLEPKEQRLLFRGKEKEDEECLHMVGVEDMSKVILLEDPASKHRKLKEIHNNEGILKACEAVSTVRSQVDNLSEKVVDLERRVNGGTKVADKEFVVLTELLMLQLLKLDSIEANGEAKVQRRIEVCRVQSYVDTLDKLKGRNCNPFSSVSPKNKKNNNKGKCMCVSTKWETEPTPIQSSNSTVISQNWELFD